MIEEEKPRNFLFDKRWMIDENNKLTKTKGRLKIT